MRALIKMLFNTKESTYHPILYYDSPLPGGGQEGLVRFKSKGHRTVGLEGRDEAIATIKPELEDRLETMGYTIIKDLEEDIPWNGEGIPTDIQLRSV